MHVSRCESSDIPIRTDSRKHIAAATVRSSAWMQRRDTRITVQIIVFYCRKTSIGAMVSHSILSWIKMHKHRIAFRVANSSFFEHELLVGVCRTNNVLPRPWADFAPIFAEHELQAISPQRCDIFPPSEICWSVKAATSTAEQPSSRAAE